MEATKPNNPQPQAPKPAVKPQPQVAKPQPMAAKPQPKKANDKAVDSNVGGIKNAFLVILVCLVLAVCLYLFVMGAISNFTGLPEGD
ncbi:MAG: hypothetical protein IIT96_00865, partial [Muribaculaceae bacterium]|nr:hypothetical protein [Muribaculaceae bacterium]